MAWQKDADEEQPVKRSMSAIGFSGKHKSSGFFSKLKSGFRKKEKKAMEMKFAREHLGSTPKKIN